MHGVGFDNTVGLFVFYQKLRYLLLWKAIEKKKCFDKKKRKCLKI